MLKTQNNNLLLMQLVDFVGIKIMLDHVPPNDFRQP